MFSIPARWIAVTVFVFSAVLNYLDRQVLATMVTIWQSRPDLPRPDFPFTDTDFGKLLAAFSLAYAISAPFMGWFLDRAGLNVGISLSVCVWALASFGTGFVHGLNELLLCRALLGIAEASGVSAVGKMVGMYLRPEERAVGSAMGQLGLSLGAGLAPQFAVFFAYQYSWRWAFYSAGLLSLLWIPVWLFTSRRIPPATAVGTGPGHGHSFGLIRDPKLWAMVAANAISMTVYSLWTNWSPRYLVLVHKLDPAAAKNYSWMVPIAGYVGAMVGGSISWRLIQRGYVPFEARKRVCLISAWALLITTLIPLMPTPALATFGMCLSFFLIAAWSTNLYTMPVDLYGAAHAGFGVSALVFAYGAMQAVISEPLGEVIKTRGFQPVCLVFGVLPLIAYALLASVVRKPAVP